MKQRFLALLRDALTLREVDHQGLDHDRLRVMFDALPAFDDQHLFAFAGGLLAELQIFGDLALLAPRAHQRVQSRANAFGQMTP